MDPLKAPSHENRPAFREWVRERLAMKAYPRISARSAFMEALALAKQLESRGYYADASDELEFAAVLLKVLHELPNTYRVEDLEVAR